MANQPKNESESIVQTLEAFGYFILKGYTSRGIKFAGRHDTDQSRIEGAGKDDQEAAAALMKSYWDCQERAYQTQEQEWAKKRQLDREHDGD